MLSLSLMFRGTFHITLPCLYWSSQFIVVEPRTLPPDAGIGLVPLPPDFFQNNPIIAKSLLLAHRFTSTPLTASTLTDHFCLKSETAAFTLERGAATDAGLAGSYTRLGGEVGGSSAHAELTKSQSLS